MKRFDAIKEIAGALAKELVVCNLGHPTRELYNAKDRPENFYMLGSMGLASSIGLGLALSQPRPVVVLDGDGSVLMNMGSLATVAHHRPPNLVLVILDNGTYGSTGDQPTISRSVPLERVCEACGIATETIRDGVRIAAAVADAIHAGETRIIVVKVEPGNADVGIIPLSPTEVRDRFMAAIGAR